MFQLLVSSVLLLFYYVGGISTNETGPFVQTPLGGIIGTYQQSFKNRIYEAYEGIPYALPPIQQRRFEPPSPIGKWSKNVTATSPAEFCIQYQHLPYKLHLENHVAGKEDCLYLNVYLPTNVPKPLPVIFAIHGGAFQYDKASTKTRFLMDRDIVFVSFSYRLSMFGFLSTEDSVIPGNMGLKDQSLALRWVHENIEYFGGDPKKITLMGLSAGAASVHYHYLSPMSKGLFQNGISFSGTALGPGKHAENSLEKAKKLAALLDCDTENNVDMVNCLKKRPAESIVNTVNQFMPWLYNPFTPFGPVVENTDDKPFINRSAIEIINSGDASDVLWITSLTRDEGLYPVADFINDKELMFDLDKNWEKIAPQLLDFNFTIPLENHDQVSRNIRRHYLGSSTINEDTVHKIVDMVGDRLYKADAYKSAKLLAKRNKSPVLFMYYHYRAYTSLSDYYTQTTKDYGVSHADDYDMMFDNGVIDTSKRPEDKAMQNKILDYVVSVATKGFPDLGLDFEWDQVDPDSEYVDYLLIKSPTDIRMVTDDDIGQRKFWSTIDFDENRLCNETFDV